MKVLKHSCLRAMLFLMAMLVVSLFLNDTTANAQGEVSYLGEVCFTLGYTYGRPPSTSRLSVLSYGNNHFSVTGTTDFGLVHGSAEIVGSNVVISLTGTNGSPIIDPSGPMRGFFMHIVIDPSTGTSLFWMQWSDDSPSSGSIGGVSFEPCPPYFQ